MRTRLRRTLWGTGRIVACAIPLLTSGCGLLDVGDDPTAVEEQDVANADGALMQRRAAVAELRAAYPRGAVFSGLVADEFFANVQRSSNLYPYELLDRRESLAYETSGVGLPDQFATWPSTRVKAWRAVERLRAYLPDAPALAGEMFAFRGFATVAMAEFYCPGVALNEVVEGRAIYGAALTTDQVFEAAVAEFDSALVYGTDSVRVLNFARLGRARALLGLGRFADAGAAAELVPTDFRLGTEHTASSTNFIASEFAASHRPVSVANREGGNGLDFVAAADPRLARTQTGTALDGTTPIYRPDKYASTTAPVVLASGVEARLIQAEAALRATPGSPQWLTILNALRTTCTDASTCPTPAPAGSGGVAGLPPLADPGSEAARVDLLFRERAFWLFGTGHRLGDLRRLVVRYGRSATAVFPTGTYYTGGAYGTGTSIPFPATSEAINPNVTGCTTR